MEIWKPIEGFEELYQISNQGRVLSFHRNSNGTILRQRKVGKYWYINLRSKGSCKTCQVHQLVASAFLGEPEPGQEVLHIEPVTESSCNNNASNLQYGTRQENALMAAKQGRHNNQKFSAAEIKELRANYAENPEPYSVIARRYKVTATTISHIINRKSYTYF